MNGVAGTVAGANRTWDWTNIPNAISADVDIRVSDYDNSTTVYAENAANNLIKGSIDLTTPDDAPITYSIGANIPITWDQVGSIGSVKVEFSAKGDFTDTIVLDAGMVTGATGTYSLSPVWTAPFTVAETYKVRVTTVSAPAGTTVTDTSTAAFKASRFV